MSLLSRCLLIFCLVALAGLATATGPRDLTPESASLKPDMELALAATQAPPQSEPLPAGNAYLLADNACGVSIEDRFEMLEPSAPLALMGPAFLSLPAVVAIAPQTPWQRRLLRPPITS